MHYTNALPYLNKTNDSRDAFYTIVFIITTSKVFCNLNMCISHQMDSTDFKYY